ncbi:MAG: gluconate 5-dehydrogenase [Bacteroidetes bacterium GWF2_42_66]|nr:MAG: gluconate 5-dehydrogenase [Bacteroidetes bacterium GWA2_42_15]OFY01260.1 MAG: gluconate 5-dehydrogenase [Bacteroidetes bacterium GWE2_42_39]OFY42103.1 MAG: gluconate 5-dehydrogenase [Bacteroidetes bacterium GWF2_42_66]HBL77694.1 gluconate 5-dehydrogenase [Prolixibacteraceae bacterium]HCB62823.1 gluconate 5-dehydrogenase [Bacteroidales bacterium]
MNELFDLTGKVALITGGTHGIGMAIGKTLGKAGAKICVNDLSQDKLDACKVEYAKEGINVFTVIFNVTDEADVDRGISIIEKEVGTIDILVNNAGIIKRIPILDMPVADFRQVIDVDLIAPLIVGKRVAPKMIEKRSGKIINMCSMMSVYGRNSVSAYASAKGGLKLLTANMCCEWAKYNLQINGIGPGYIATSQTAAIREGNHPFNDLVMTRTPAGRWGEPEDVGNAALFLASKASDFVNGHVLYVDGGILANFGYVKGENDLPE